MSTITLTEIKSTQEKLAAMIAAFESQEKSEIHFPEMLIPLQPGEHYAGLIIGTDGNPSYHLVLLPGKADAINWNNAEEWAKKQGGEYVASLPTRREQSLLFANLKEQFEGEYYWSSEDHASDSGFAWYQTFDYGLQGITRKLNELRARAVRRLIIE